MASTFWQSQLAAISDPQSYEPGKRREVRRPFPDSKREMLTRAIDAHRLSTEQVAKIAGATRATVGGWLYGKVSSIPERSAIAFEQYFGIEL